MSSTFSFSFPTVAVQNTFLHKHLIQPPSLLSSNPPPQSPSSFSACSLASYVKEKNSISIGNKLLKLHSSYLKMNLHLQVLNFLLHACLNGRNCFPTQGSQQAFKKYWTEKKKGKRKESKIERGREGGTKRLQKPGKIKILQKFRRVFF